MISNIVSLGMDVSIPHRFRAGQTISIAMLVFLFTILAACSSKDDTEAIRQLIRDGADLAQKRKIGDLMELTDDGFSAQPGGHDNRTTRAVLLRAFMHYGNFKLHFPKPAVELADHGLNAKATVHFLIVRQKQTIPGLKELYDDPKKWIETVGEKADLYQLKLSMVKTDGDWLVGAAILEPFKGTGF